MDRSEILRELMIKRNMKVADIAKKSELPYTSIKSILERSTEKASYINICKICYALGITPDELERMANSEKTSSPTFSQKELDIIKKYGDLDDNGRTHVDTVLDWETQRMELYKQALAEREQQKPQIVEIEKVAPPRYSIIYYQRLASAGTGEYLFNDIPTDIIEVLDTPIARRADFALGVNGNSMEPTYYDGDKVYVEITDEIPTGSIGIFTRGNECLIKELGTDRLISHNKEYGDIPAREDIKLVGLVLGKVAEV